MTNLWSGSINTNGEYQKLADITGLTFITNETYEIQVQNPELNTIYLRSGTIGKGNLINNSIPYKQLVEEDEDLYIKTNYQTYYCDINIVGDKSSLPTEAPTEAPTVTPEYTFTINPTPVGATVILTATGATQSGNSITVDDGTTVSYTVSDTGYVTATGTYTIDGANYTLNVTLEAEQQTTCTLTIIHNNDATANFDSDDPNHIITNSSITVEAGRHVLYYVENNTDGTRIDSYGNYDLLHGTSVPDNTYNKAFQISSDITIGLNCYPEGALYAWQATNGDIFYSLRLDLTDAQSALYPEQCSLYYNDGETVAGTIDGVEISSGMVYQVTMNSRVWDRSINNDIVPSTPTCYIDASDPNFNGDFYYSDVAPHVDIRFFADELDNPVLCTAGGDNGQTHAEILPPSDPNSMLIQSSTSNYYWVPLWGWDENVENKIPVIGETDQNDQGYLCFGVMFEEFDDSTISYFDQELHIIDPSTGQDLGTEVNGWQIQPMPDPELDPGDADPGNGVRD